MTRTEKSFQPKSKKAGFTPGQFCFGIFSIFCLLLMLRNSDTAIEYMNRGLRLCVTTVIPSLFPFMVLSELIVSGGIGSAVMRPVAPLIKKLFRVPETGACAALLGMFCGFPVGAKCAVSAFDRGLMTRSETERVLTFSNNPSSAFLINAVGLGLWGNRKFGLALYLTVLVSQILCGILFAHLPHRKESETPVIPSAKSGLPSRKGAAFFTDAIRSACTGMMLVCAYVIFFSAFVGTLSLLLENLRLPAVCKATVFCLFELSGGMSAAASLPASHSAALLCAFAAGWSGLSVHCQILSVCDGRGLRFRSYFLAKVLQGLLCILIFSATLKCFPELTIPAQQVAAVSPVIRYAVPAVTGIFLISLLTVYRRKK